MIIKDQINCKGKIVDLSTPKVMGILNITPDSFSDGGKYNRVDAALTRIDEMLSQGVDIIDIGAVSSRPGSTELSVKEEGDRLFPILKVAVHHFPEAIFSIDTYRSEIAREAIALGASMINDITAGSFDEGMPLLISQLKVPYIIMHMNGSPATMQENPIYDNISLNIIDYFIPLITKYKRMGIADLIIDPGFGFGKTLEHNYQLFKKLSSFSILDVPLLVGISRKSMIYKTLNCSPLETLAPMSALHWKALEFGAKILRVHDVKEAKQIINLHTYYQHVSS